MTHPSVGLPRRGPIPPALLLLAALGCSSAAVKVDPAARRPDESDRDVMPTASLDVDLAASKLATGIAECFVIHAGGETRLRTRLLAPCTTRGPVRVEAFDGFTGKRLSAGPVAVELTAERPAVMEVPVVLDPITRTIGVSVRGQCEDGRELHGRGQCPLKGE